MTRYRALLVGNSAFPEDPHSLPTLIGPTHDVEHLRTRLSDSESGLFSLGEITTLLNPPSWQVIRALGTFFGRARRDDVLLFYYSGHGRLDIHNVLYLCTHDAQTDLLEATTVSSVRVKEFVHRTAAINTIIMLDCCHSGAYKGNDIARALRNPKSYVMTSCRPDDLANDASATGRTSMFTEQVVEGLARAPAHGPSFDHVTIEDLFGYVRDGLQARGKQVPQFITRGDGDLPIARRAGIATPVQAVDTQPGTTLRVSETLIDLGEVALDDVLPLERIYITAVRADGRPARWTARTSASWVGLGQQVGPDRLELDVRPSTSGGRANVEVRNEDTGDVVTVRIVMRLRNSPLSHAASYDRVNRAAARDPAPFPQSGRPDPPSPPDPVAPGTAAVRRPQAATEPVSHRPAAGAGRHGGDVDQLIEQFVGRVPGVRQSILVTEDGLVAGANGPLGRDDLDRLAAGISGLRNGGRHLAAVADATPLSIVVDLYAGVVMVDPGADRPLIGLFATADMNLDAAAHDMTALVRVSRARTPPAGPAPPAGRPVNEPSEAVASDQSWILDSLVDDVGHQGLIGCVVASVDGFALATDRGFPYRSGRAAAAASALFASCHGVSTQVGGGPVRQVVVRTHRGYCTVIPFGDATMLVQFLTDDADLGVSGYEAMRLAGQVGDVFLKPHRRR